VAAHLPQQLRVSGVHLCIQSSTTDHILTSHEKNSFCMGNGPMEEISAFIPPHLTKVCVSIYEIFAASEILGIMQCNTANNSSVCRSGLNHHRCNRVQTAIFGAGMPTFENRLDSSRYRYGTKLQIMLTVSNYFLVDQEPKTNLAKSNKSRHWYVILHNDNRMSLLFIQ
jgi:hypothetical protein